MGEYYPVIPGLGYLVEIPYGYRPKRGATPETPIFVVDRRDISILARRLVVPDPMADDESGPKPFNVKQQIDQMASAHQSSFESLQRELCNSHVTRVTALREQLASCRQACADQELRSERLETAMAPRAKIFATAGGSPPSAGLL